MSNFQVILLSVFGVFIIVAVVIFALTGTNSSTQEQTIVIWGSLSAQTFNSFTEKYYSSGNAPLKVVYTEIPASNFENTVIEAIASGRGPDVALLSQDMIVKMQDKIFHIPFQSFPERDFKNTFVEEGEMYIWSDGILGLPFTLDPLVMYWNRDIFSSASLADYPKYWTEFPELAKKLTKLDGKLNIIRSATAMGEYANVSYAKEIVSALIMQAGNEIVKRDSSGPRAVLGERLENQDDPAQLALSFYTQFSNPVKTTYSWNRSLANSRDRFISGDLAVYFGFASDLQSIRAKNPNLNFDVAMIPQTGNSVKKTTFGKMQALTILKSSPNVSSAFSAITKLISPASLEVLNSITNLPSPRRDMLGEQGVSAFMKVFDDSALISKAWLDPDRVATNGIFEKMITDTTNGRLRVNESVNRAGLELANLIK